MKFTVEVSNEKIRELIYEYLCCRLGQAATPEPKDIKIKVRSKQNYREQQWEDGELMVKFEGDV